MTTEFDNTTDVIDSSNVIEAIDALQNKWSATTGDEFTDYSISGDDLLVGLSEEDAERYQTLCALRDEADSSPDWQYGEALIRDSYFAEYAEQLADDIGAIDRDAGWPLNCIDWERAARELQVDYTAVDFDGITYWIRS